MSLQTLTESLSADFIPYRELYQRQALERTLEQAQGAYLNACEALQGVHGQRTEPCLCSRHRAHGEALRAYRAAYEAVHGE